MPWLKLLHIATVIVWCGAVICLPTLIAGALREETDRAGPSRRLVRLVFAGVMTPAALIAIASGTAIFTFQGPVMPWLMAKLALVGLLVWAHGACGFLILKVERGQPRGVLTACRVLTGLTVLLLLFIAWLVLAKPA